MSRHSDYQHRGKYGQQQPWPRAAWADGDDHRPPDPEAADDDRHPKDPEEDAHRAYYRCRLLAMIEGMLSDLTAAGMKEISTVARLSSAGVLRCDALNFSQESGCEK